MGTRLLLAAALVAMPSVAVEASQSTAAATDTKPVRPTTAPSREAIAERYLEEKNAAQASAIAELRAAGVNYGNVRSIVARYETMLKPNAFARASGMERQLNEIFLSDVAIELAVLGFGPSDMRDEQSARRLFIAAANKRRSVASADDLTLLSSEVVEGRIVDYVYENQEGPSTIYAVIDVTRSEKGTIVGGERIRIPLISKRLGADLFERDSSELLGEPGTAVKAYLSVSARRFRGPDGRVPDAADIFVKIADFEIL